MLARGVRGRFGLPAAGWILLCWGVAPLAGADADRESALAEVRERIAELGDRLAAIEGRRESLAAELISADLALRLQEERVAEARLSREAAEEALEQVEAQALALAGRWERLRDALAGSLLRIYRLGRGGSMRLLLSVPSADDLLPALRTLRFLAKRDSELLARVRDTGLLVAENRLRREQQRARAERWLAREVERLAALEQLRGEKAALLASVRAEREALERETELLVVRERRLHALVETLAGRSTRPLAEARIQEFRGVLDWPVEGTIVEGFGPRIDRRYGTRVPHNGLDLVTLDSARVRAVYPGTVLYADDLEGYGKTVVIRHPGRVFSLYAGLRELQVATEDVVLLAQPLGWATGRLYFEIRVGNRPADPEAWLR